MNVIVISGAVFVIFCSWMLVHAYRNYQRAMASRNWPSTRGHITELALWGKRNIDGIMKDAEKLKVSYQYELEGTEFSGDTVAFYTLVYPDTVTFCEAHSQGSQVLVYYDPANPADSVLMPGFKSESRKFSDIILATVGVLLAVTLIVAGATGLLE